MVYITLDEPGNPVFTQWLIISLLTEEGFDAASKLAIYKSVRVKYYYYNYYKIIKV
jgi:hypothetical protein